MLFFLEVVFPYIAAMIFIMGILYKLRRWLTLPAPFPLTLSPAPAGKYARFKAMLKELLWFDSLFRHNGVLWFLAWTMHLALVLIIVGHIAGIYSFRQQFMLVGMSREGSQALSDLLGTLAGAVFLISLLGLAGRRICQKEARTASGLLNYFELGLLIAIGLTGMELRWTIAKGEFFLIRQYMAGLILLRPAFMPVSPWFLLHFSLVNILIIYLPFSRLIHGLGAGITRLLLTEEVPAYPTAPGRPFRSAFTGSTGHQRFASSGTCQRGEL